MTRMNVPQHCRFAFPLVLSLSLACGGADDAIGEGATVGQEIASEPSCQLACERVETCGLLDGTGVTHGSCVSVCMQAYEETEAQWASGASCDDLESALEVKSPPSVCELACDKVDSCGILESNGIERVDCPSICETEYTEAQARLALDATCAQLEAVLGGGQAMTICEQACDKVEACGILESAGVAPEDCPAKCEAEYTEAQAGMALDMTCDQLEAVLGVEVPASPCEQACEKAGSCGILDEFGLDLVTCPGVCEQMFNEAEASWSLGASCDEIRDAVHP